MSPQIAFPPASLAVVALPLGNPGDITHRALEILRQADWIAAEDTRTVGRMLAALGVRGRFLSYHDWNEAERAPQIVDRLRQGARIALVSEAGTPGISDPGYDVVSLARRQKLHVFPVPGPSALVTFLSASGLPTDRFTFLGFPPRKDTKLTAFLESYAARTETLVFYESPRRITATLERALATFGPRLCALGRELTKEHEEFLFGPLPQILEELRNRTSVRGEICWGVEGAGSEREEMSEDRILDAARTLLGEDLQTKPAARKLSEQCGITVKEAYAILNGLKSSTRS